MQDDVRLLGGLHTVTAALRQGRVRELWVAEGRADIRMRDLLVAASEARVTPRQSPRKALDARLPGVNHQGVVARCAAARLLGEGALDEILGRLEVPLLLLLDGVQDPHNLGACLRSADAAGVHAVVVPKNRAVGLTPVVRKVASGAADAVPVIQVTNLARTLRRLGSDWGLRLVGAAGEAPETLFETDLTGPLGMVMGAEGAGLRRLTRAHCDALVRLPMVGTVASLNVSVATGICLFEAVRQRALAVVR